MSEPRYELVVIGAGIHGAGVAQAAAACGHSVLVLEQSAIAAGTSSRSSKLIHGGLRYLESGQLRLVRQSLRERGLLLRLAPGLVELVPFHIPIYADTRRRPWQIGLGLALYAVLGGLAPTMRYTRLAREEWGRLDGLRREGLQAVFRYYDAQTDDAALTRAVLASAQQLGAELKCPARFVAAHRDAEGYRVHYAHGGEQSVCRARTLVNAAGPWVNHVLAAVTPAAAPALIELVRGTHIVVAGGLRAGLYYVEAPADRRAVFVMPWRDKTLVGTTETVYVGDPAVVQPTPAEIDYLRATLSHYFPDHPSEVLDAYAGLRVLPKAAVSPFRRVREVWLLTDRPRAPRLVSICGGKLTGYRATAAAVMKRLKSSLPRPRRRLRTDQLPLEQF